MFCNVSLRSSLLTLELIWAGKTAKFPTKSRPTTPPRRPRIFRTSRCRRRRRATRSTLPWRRWPAWRLPSPWTQTTCSKICSSEKCSKLFQPRRGDNVIKHVFSSSPTRRQITPSMDKLQLTGQNLGRVFNFRSDHLHAATYLVSSVKLPNLQLKTQPKQLLGSLPLVITLPAPSVFALGQYFQEHCSRFLFRFRTTLLAICQFGLCVSLELGLLNKWPSTVIH